MHLVRSCDIKTNHSVQNTYHLYFKDYLIIVTFLSHFLLKCYNSNVWEKNPKGTLSVLAPLSFVAGGYIRSYSTNAKITGYELFFLIIHGYEWGHSKSLCIHIHFLNQITSPWQVLRLWLLSQRVDLPPVSVSVSTRHRHYPSAFPCWTRCPAILPVRFLMKLR